MTEPTGTSRRGALMKLGIMLNGIVAAVLALPIVRYILSPASHAARGAYQSWIPLGDVSDFPPNQTRLATYRNPVATAWDGTTADIACWVRHLEGDNFQVFATNCAHLGCPVRWFPQSGLFLCPCHGGVYYQDGSRASGPPERGLFELHYKIDNGKLSIKAGELPTPGGSAANGARGGGPCV